MAAGYDLKLIELEPEDPAAVLDQGPDAEGTSRGPRVHRGLEVPHLDLAVIGSRHDTLTVEPDTPH